MRETENEEKKMGLVWFFCFNFKFEDVKTETRVTARERKGRRRRVVGTGKEVR